MVGWVNAINVLIQIEIDIQWIELEFKGHTRIFWLSKYRLLIIQISNGYLVFNFNRYKQNLALNLCHI